MRGLKLTSSILVAAVIGVTYVATAGRADARSARANHQPYVTIGIIQQGAPINYYNNAGLQWGGLDVMPLGYVKIGSPNPNAFFPALAKSWSMSKNGRQITVHIQPKAHWSNGQAVTAKDLIETAAIGYASGNSQSFYLGTVKALNSKTVRYTMLAGAKFNLFGRNVLEQAITPASVFDSQLPSDIWSVIKASQYQGTDPTLVAKQKAAANTLTDLYKKIQAYAPPKDVSDGPYVLRSYNPGEAILVKNPHFYAAGRIHIGEVILRNYNSQNQEIWNYLLGGQVYQATSGGMSSSLVRRISAVPHNHLYKVSSTASAQLIFNESVYPYNKVQVRKALAYLINRKSVQRVAEPVGGTYNHWPTSTVDSNTRAYLTKSQIKHLNPYTPSYKDAEAQLRAAGFKKSGNRWMMSNGKPFAVTLTTVNGFNDWVEASAQIKSELERFGISTSVQLSPSYAQYLKDLEAGKVSFGFWIGVGLTPAGIATRLYGSGDGYDLEGGKLFYYPPSAQGKGNWLDFPKSVNVRGYGNVSVGPLAAKLSTITNKAQVRTIMQKLFLATNQYVPEITLWNYVTDGFVNDKYFTHYPTKNRIVMQTCNGYYPPIGCWETLGYVRPR